MLMVEAVTAQTAGGFAIKGNQLARSNKHKTLLAANPTAPLR
jgi:hypothetical protein